MKSFRLWFSGVWPGFLLIAGFGAAGFTSGFMVGGSATPVVGAILPAIISAISAGVVAFSQSQIKTGGEAIALESRRRLIGWVGGLMFIFSFSTSLASIAFLKQPELVDSPLDWCEASRWTKALDLA
jgi:hypothetical protein